MNTSQRQGLRARSYRDILILRILVGLIRLVYDIPAFFAFLIRGSVSDNQR